MIENIKLAIQKYDDSSIDNDLIKQITQDYGTINGIDITEFSKVLEQLDDILMVFIPESSDELIGKIYKDITNNNITTIPIYKITPNVYISEDKFQSLLLDIKNIYIKDSNLLYEYLKFKANIKFIYDVLDGAKVIYDLTKSTKELDKIIQEAERLKLEYTTQYEKYRDDIKPDYKNLKNYLFSMQGYLDDKLSLIVPSFDRALSTSTSETHKLIVALIAQFKVKPPSMGIAAIYNRVVADLTVMEAIYRSRYEAIKNKLIELNAPSEYIRDRDYNIADIEDRNPKLVESKNMIDTHKLSCDEIFKKLMIMKGGNNIDKELLKDAVAAFLIKNSNQKNFKSLLVSLISDNITIKNNKIKITLPKINEILKIISLPLYCTDKGINVTYSNMQKCVKNNIHNYVDNKNKNKYLKELNLTDNLNYDLLAKEFDYRINQIEKIINKYRL